ncbi:MAG: hypothetical protein QXS02_02290 [Candidatus Thermoplasmatota archaeon]
MTYYWEKKGNVFHWSLQCSKVPIHVKNDPNWATSPDRPNDKIPCSECREIEIKKQFKK